MPTINYQAIRLALIAQGKSDDEIEEIFAKAKGTKIRKAKVEETDPEVLAHRKQQAEDDERSEEYKARLVSAYHKKANGAGRKNPLIRLREIKHIKADANVRGLSRFEAGPAPQRRVG